MRSSRTGLAGRLRRGWRRGSASLVGMLLLVSLSVAWAVAWHVSRDATRLAEMDRERGRLWGMACVATHRAVQAGLVTSARAVTVAQLQAPPAPFQPFLPAGLALVEKVGVGGVEDLYGAVVVGGVPMAVCGLSGSELAFRAPALREGALSGGLEQLGVVDGDVTAMHARLGDVQAVLGPLATGSMFVTADFGIGHASDRLHRRLVGGRPELQRMERNLEFANLAGVRNAGLLDGQRADVVAGTFRGTSAADVAGGVVVEAGASLRLDSAATGVTARGGFEFGPQGGPFTIPQLLTVGSGLTVRGAVSAGSMTATRDVDAGGAMTAANLVSRGNISAGETLTASRLEASQSVDAGASLIAGSATVSGGATAQGSLRTGSLTATGRIGVTGRLQSRGPVTSTGRVTAGSVNTGGRLVGNSGSFGALTVGSCDGCGPTL